MRTVNSGILLINKHKDVTSRYISNAISKAFNTKKVGHLGTLDPFATGLLIIGVNEGTKVFPFLEDDEKTYVATFKLGYLTSTLDPEGEVLEDSEIPSFTLQEISETLKTFVGEITQIPPMTSAIKVDGKRLYKYARENREVAIPPRQVFVHKLRLLDYIHPFLKVEATVSKGTYIRTLGADIAKALNTVATTVELERTKHGDFSVKDAKPLSEVSAEDIISPSVALSMFPIVEADEKTLMAVRNGQLVELNTTAEIVQVVDENNVLHALCRRINHKYQSFRGFNL